MNIIIWLWLVLGLLFLVVGIVVTWLVYIWRTYKYKIILRERIDSSNHYKETKRYRARLIRHPGSIGGEVLWVPKAKRYASPYGEKTGINQYTFCVGPDGLWYPIVYGELDSKKGVIDIVPVDKDVRDWHTTNQKNINERYNKPKNWPMVLMSFTIILALMIIFVGGWVIWDKVRESQDVATSNVKASTEATKAAADVLEGINNLLSGGKLRSGLVPVNNTNG